MRKTLMLTRLALFAVALTMAAWLATGSAQEEAQRVPQGRIVFASNEDNNPGDIYVINADGTRRIRLTRDPAYDGHPTWSPDGQEIAFWSKRDSNAGDIYTMQVNGQGVMRLTRHVAQDAFPSWSPDGQQIAFASNRDSNRGDIYVMNIDGTEPMRLTYAPQAETHPCWSPDGSQIAFVHWRGDGTSGIHVVPAEGGTPQQLIAAGDRCADPAWCPVRDEVVFVVGRGNAVWGDLWFIDALAGTLLSQWKYRGREMEPTWSPDGTMVCCSHSRRREGEHADLMVFDVNTRDIWQVTKGTAIDREPDWWMPEQ